MSIFELKRGSFKKTYRREKRKKGKKSEEKEKQHFSRVANNYLNFIVSVWAEHKTMLLLLTHTRNKS